MMWNDFTPRRLPPAKDPTLVTNLRVHTSTFDEWYGLDATFDWTPEGLRRWQALPPAPGPGTNPSEWQRRDTEYRAARRAFVDVVATEVLAAPVTHAYYAKPHKVTVLCDGGGGDGGGDRTVTIPIFRAADFCDWEFTAKGGWLDASDRD